MDVLKGRKRGTTCRTGLRRTSAPIAAIDTVFICYVKCGYIGVNEWVSGKSLGAIIVYIGSLTPNCFFPQAQQSVRSLSLD